MNINDIHDEGQAFEALHILRARFGWAGTMFGREDADAILEGEHSMDAMTDEQWLAVQSTWEWRKGLTEIITERGFEIISTAVDQVVVTD